MCVWCLVSDMEKYAGRYCSFLLICNMHVLETFLLEIDTQVPVVAISSDTAVKRIFFFLPKRTLVVYGATELQSLRQWTINKW